MSRIPKTPKPTPRTPQQSQVAAAMEEGFRLGAWHGISIVKHAWGKAHPEDLLDDVDAAIAEAIKELEEQETGSTSG